MENLESVNSQELSSAGADIPIITVGHGYQLTITSAQAMADYSTPIALPPQVTGIIEASYQFLKAHVDSRVPIYGINTNFGDQVRYIDSAIKEIDSLDYYHAINERQENIIRSLSCGLGRIVSPSIVRVTMMLRAHCLAQGYSGVHPELINSLLDCCIVFLYGFMLVYWVLKSTD